MPDLQSIASSFRPRAAKESPIESAFDGLRAITEMAVRMATVGWNANHGLILSSASVAVAEDYVRSVLVELGKTCPLTRDRIAGLETSMSHVYSGSVDDALRASLDRVSFSDRGAIRDWTKKISGLVIGKEGELAECLDEFHRACHIRHCATHAGGYVAAGNALVLGVDAGRWIVFSDQRSIHSIVAVVTAFIRSYNAAVFADVLSRLLDQGQFSGEWDRDRKLFVALWNIFRCRPDLSAGRSRGLGSFPATAYHAFLKVRPAAQARAAGGRGLRLR